MIEKTYNGTLICLWLLFFYRPYSTSYKILDNNIKR